MKTPIRVRRTAAPRLIATAVAAMLFCACGYALLRGGKVNEKQAARVESGIEQLRQLRFKNQVPMVVRSSDQVEQLLEADLKRDYTDEQLEVEGAAGALVGLYPAGMDLKEESLKLLKSQIAGFYDPHSKEMVLVKGGTSTGFLTDAAEFLVQRDIVGEMLLAHELTHALQDQHFDLEKKLDRVKNDDDRALALKCVAEGDATLAGFGYVMGSMSDANADTLAERMHDLPQAFAAQSADTPEGLSVPLLFQYSAGVDFVAEAYRRGGWDGVDALYINPPQSSHQIIHPALYFERPALPLNITVGGYEQVMPGWRKADEDTYGELLLKVILERNLGKASHQVDLSRLWSGDHMVILKQGRGITVVWIIVFDDAQTASQFAAVYTTILDRLLDSATEHRIDYRSNAVLITIGEGAHYFGTLAPSIWRNSRIAPSGEVNEEAAATGSP